MPKDYSRALRIADQIQRELADLFATNSTTRVLG